MKIGLLGGTFDPIHSGHLALGQAALKELKLARVYFVLSPSSPFKTGQKKESVENRIGMIRAAIKGRPQFSLGKWELKRKGRSYTITTLNFLRRKRPRDQFYFIMGSDIIPTLKKWKNPAQIAQRSQLVVGRRPGFVHKSIPPKFKDAILFLKGRFPKVSSTHIRRALKNKKGRPKDLPLSVYRLIRKRGLYDE